MTKKLLFGFLFLSFSVIAQMNTEGLENFNTATFQDIEKKEDRDVTIIFDRTYIDVKKKSTIEVFKTTHRKIKIHSQHGLENYNKLYIPTINSFDTKIGFVDCKVKTLKEGNTTVLTASKNMISTTLPANAPFFYKVSGEVKMLAIKDVNIGDEIEYIFTTKQTFDYSNYFYKMGKVNFEANDHCLEKSLFIFSKKFNVKIWPYNFKNGVTRTSDFSYVDGQKVSLKNINPNYNELYGRSNLDSPYVFYEVSSIENTKSNDTWKDFAKYLKPKRQDIRKNYVLDGKTIAKALDEIDTIQNTEGKYKSILDKINIPIEKHFYNYNDIKGDIDVALSYAKVISKTSKKLGLPINFHFVISKNNGKLDKSLVNLYQFDTILCSFINNNGNVNYFPLLEPYSSFNDIRKEYQQSECFTINQDLNGNRTYKFDFIPKLETGYFQKEVYLSLKQKEADTLNFSVKEALKFSGHSWTEIKPIISYVLEDSLKVKKRLKSFIENQVVLSNKLDSIYNINYSKKENIFTVDYQYDIKKQIQSKNQYFKISPILFFEKDFHTPYFMKKGRTSNGYLTDEFNTNYLFSFDGNCEWQENNLLRSSTTNELGNVKSTYKYVNKKIESSVKLTVEKTEFKPQQWEKMVDLREAMYDFLNSNLYFKI